MKILVVVANFGTKNDGYLSRVISEYRSMPYDVDLVVTSNILKDLGKDVEVLVGLPSKNPHSLPFAHKRVFAERKDAYDLFIYTEDDILITERNIEAFLRVEKILPANEIVGFFRWEQYPDGRKYYPEAHAFHHWMPDFLKTIGDHTFARFTNEHSGCYALTRGQLARAIASGGFLVAPHEYKHGMLESAATDPYMQCGLEKWVCVSHFDEFLVPHLPNKYIGSWLGLDEQDFHREFNALLHHRQSGGATQPLLETGTKAFHREYSKNRYEPCRDDLIATFPETTRTVLSIGCGWGKTEAELAKRGIEVTAIPLDRMIAACAEARGVNLIYGTLESAIEQLRGRQFDGVLMPGILHLFPKPADALMAASAVLARDGVLAATLPAFRRLPSRWERLRHPSRYKGWKDFERSGMHALTRRQVRSWFREAGLSLERVTAAVPKHWESVRGLSRALAEELFARQYTMVGRQTRNMAKPNQQTATLQSQVEPEVTYTVDERPNR
jgi:SAM-dependent methyltransferase